MTNWKTLIIVIGFAVTLTATAVAGWLSVKGDIADHAKQLAAVQKTVSEDHDIGVAHTAQITSIATVVDRIEHKLDRIPRVPETVTTTTKTETVVHPP